jgi:hypothetical protein
VVQLPGLAAENPAVAHLTAATILRFPATSRSPNWPTFCCSIL